MNILRKLSKSSCPSRVLNLSQCLFSSSKKDKKIESLAIEPEDDLYLSYLKNEFTDLYTTNYKTKIPGYATQKDTKYYSLRKEIGEL